MSTKLKDKKAANKHSKAQGLVEFALILPILLMVVVGMMELGRLLFFYTSVTSAAREGARYGSAVGEVGGVPRYQDCAGIRNEAQQAGFFADLEDADIQIRYDDGVISNTKATCPVSGFSLNSPSDPVVLADRVEVTVTKTWEAIVPLVPLPDIPFSSSASRTIIKEVGVKGTPQATDIPPGAEIPVLTAVKSASFHTDNDGDGLPSPGDILEYSIVIDNSSDYPAADVGLVDTIDANTDLVVGSVSSPIGTISEGNSSGDSDVVVENGALAAHSSTTISFRVEIDDPFPDGVTAVVNEAIVSATNIGPVTSNEVVTQVYAGLPAFTAEKTETQYIDTDGSGTRSLGDTVEYSVLIQNVANGDATDVLYDDILDPNTTLVIGSVSTTEGSVVVGNGGGHTSVQVDVGNLDSTEDVTIEYQATINNDFPSGVSGIYNQGEVQCDELGDITYTDDPATPAADDETYLEVDSTKSYDATKEYTGYSDEDGSGSVTPGDILFYKVVVKSTGVGIITDVVFTDTPGDNTTLENNNISTTRGTVTHGDDGGDSYLEVEIGDLGVNQKAEITFRVRINNPLPAGVTYVENQGKVTSLELPNIDTDDPSTGTVGDATRTYVGSVVLSMTATKSQVSPAAGVDVYPGDTIEYEIVILNTGNAAINDIVFTDVPDSYLTLVDGALATYVGTLLPGENYIFNLKFEVDSAIPTSVTEVDNYGTLSSSNAASVNSNTVTTQIKHPLCPSPIALDVDAKKVIFDIQNPDTGASYEIEEIYIRWPNGTLKTITFDIKGLSPDDSPPDYSVNPSWGLITFASQESMIFTFQNPVDSPVAVRVKFANCDPITGNWSE